MALKVLEMCAQMTHKLVMLVAKKVNTDEPSAACSDWHSVLHEGRALPDKPDRRRQVEGAGGDVSRVFTEAVACG